MGQEFLQGDNLTETELNAIYLRLDGSNSTDWTDLTDGGETTLHIHDGRYYTKTEVDNGLTKYWCDTTIDDRTANYTTTGTVTAGAIIVTGTSITISHGSNPTLFVTDTTNTVTTVVQSQNAFGLLGTTTNHPLVLATNSIGRLTIDTSGNFAFGAGNLTTTGIVDVGKLIVSAAGDEIGGVAGANEVVARVQNTDGTQHTALSINAPTGKDAVLFLAENDVAWWDIRHDVSSADRFQIRYQGGTGANITLFTLRTNGRLVLTDDLTLGGMSFTGNTIFGSSGALILRGSGTGGVVTINDDWTAAGQICADGGLFTIATFANTGLHLLDTDASHDLILKPGSNLSADRILTITTGDAARTITLSGNPTLSDWFDQAVKQASSPTFDGLTIDGTFTDGTLSIASGSITSAVNGTFSGTGRFDGGIGVGTTPSHTVHIHSDITLANNGFEDGDFTGWETAAFGAIVISVVSSDQNSGTYSAKVVGTGSGDTGWYIRTVKIPIVGGRTYKVSFWSKHNQDLSSVSGGGFDTVFRWFDSGGSNIQEDEFELGTANGSWHLETQTFTAPPAAVDLVVSFGADTPNMVTDDFFLVDDVVLEGSNTLIVKSGKIGFGTDTPAVGFDVVGGARFGDSSTNYTDFSSTGDMSLVGSAQVVSDLPFASAKFLVFDKASGNGIKVDTTTPTFGFADLLGDVTVKNTGGTRPALITYRDGLLEFEFAATEEEYFKYHIPHDYVKGTDLFLHFHWSHIATTVNGGSITFEYEMSYSKAHDGGAFPASVSGTVVGSASNTQYQQQLTEVQISATTPSGSQIDTDDLEPDGVIIVTAGVQANNITVTGGGVPDPFIHYVDIHYQTTGLIGTKSKAPDFYS